MAIWEQPELMKQQTPEIALCIPHQQIVTIQWALMFRQLQLPPHIYFFNGGMPVDVAREQMVRSALKRNPKYIMFIDTDNVPESPDAVLILKQIAEQKNLDIVSGLYWARKRDTNQPAAWKIIGREGNTVKFAPVIVEEHIPKGNIIEVDAVGMGFCLIKTEVFKKLEKKNPGKPFFEWGLLRPRLPQVSEDFNFCLRCIEETSTHPHVATSVLVKHICIAEKTGKTGELKLTKV